MSTDGEKIADAIRYLADEQNRYLAKRRELDQLFVDVELRRLALERERLELDKERYAILDENRNEDLERLNRWRLEDIDRYRYPFGESKAER